MNGLLILKLVLSEPMEKFKDYPTILITVKGIGFDFLLDTSCKHNLCTPCFADYFNADPFVSLHLVEEKETDESLSTEPYQPLFSDVVQRQNDIKKIRCKNGIMAGCESIKVKFQYEGKDCSETFYIDQSLCTYCKTKEKVGGILGIHFLKKHKFVIDFNKQEIDRK